MATTIYFVRHGQSNSNADGTFRGPESTLTEQGQREARVVAERVERIGVDAILASSYIRAIETARPIGARLNLPVEGNDLFIELRRPSVHMGNRMDDPKMREETTMLFENFGNGTYQHSDEETFDEFRDRAVAALAYLKNHPAERVCVVTHGIFIRALFCAMHNGPSFTGEDFRKTWKLGVSNTGITHVEYREGKGHWDRGWHVLSWNDSAHLG